MWYIPTYMYVKSDITAYIPIYNVIAVANIVQLLKSYYLDWINLIIGKIFPILDFFFSDESNFLFDFKSVEASQPIPFL
jgi:hypothetical protein